MGLVDQIKNDVKKSGSNKGKFIYFREGQKIRLRFLQDMDDGMQITFHDNFERGIQVPCQELFGRDCPYCEEEGIRTRSQYIWSVWNYEQNEVQLFMFPVNNCSPIPPLMAMYENYGTITDRDYVISVQGKQQNKSYTVVPMDKNKFRNTKAKPYSENAVLKMLDKAWPCDADDDDEEDERPRKKPKSSKGAKKETAKKEAEDWGEKLPDKDELEEMSPQKLYNLCRERDIDVAPRKKASYYVEMLEDWREENEEPDDDSDDDYDGDWGDDEEDDAPDYSEMTAKELYKLCKERDIEAAPKKPEKYYIRLLEEADQAEDDWGDGGDDDDDWEDE